MRWLRTWWLRFRRYTPVRVEEISSPLKRRRVYLLGDVEEPWCAAVLCPCGCRKEIYLSLIPDDRPSWRFTEHEDGTVSLHPSVWRVRGCRSHFVLRRGEIHWCPEASSETRQIFMTQ